ncbi:MAG TPA: FMN-binding negative transcriptional regulator [Xanthobacteraceae bacterium]|nr:FMN-binding negative transcriptional regulator [Xanthobacteraceae bacterium]
MYIPPAFRIDRAECLAFAAARGFGLVVAFDGVRPAGSPLPFHISYRDDGTPVASFHVARNNPLAALATRGGNWLLAVNGADAYVSPEWYVSPEQVPTWLYETVHLSGPVHVVSSEGKRPHLDGLTGDFERASTGDVAWTPERLTSGRREAMLNGIVAIEMNVDAVEGSAKLNQNKSDADFQAVAQQLRRQDDSMARQIAARMVALRPNLSYDVAGEDMNNG